MELVKEREENTGIIREVGGTKGERGKFGISREVKGTKGERRRHEYNQGGKRHERREGGTTGINREVSGTRGERRHGR